MSADQDELVYSGQVFLLETSCGGYDPDRGWTGDADDEVEPVPPLARASADQDQSSCDQDDLDTQSESRWLTICEHCANVAKILRESTFTDSQITAALDWVGANMRHVLDLAARWHDRGKAHPAFEAKLRPADLKSDRVQRLLAGEPAAKAPKDAWRPARDPTLPRPGFRHELASALAALETLRLARPQHEAFAWPEGLERPNVEDTQPSRLDAAEYKALIDELANLSADDVDLFAYLIAAHHGKVRMSLRSSPDDSKSTGPDPCPGETAQARGVRNGDVVPACSLPGPSDAVLRAPEVTLHLDPMSLGLSGRYGPSWRERMQALLERLGPFRLAYLEALLRAADCRASGEERRESSADRGEGHVREDSEAYVSDRESLREFVRRWAEAGPALEELR